MKQGTPPAEMPTEDPLFIWSNSFSAKPHRLLPDDAVERASSAWRQVDDKAQVPDEVARFRDPSERGHHG